MGKIVYLNEYSNTKEKSELMSNLTKDKMLEIENKVNEITSDLDFTSSPSVDIVSIVKKAGFIVEPSLMPIETTGYLLVDDNPSNPEKIIVVNKVFKNPDDEDDVIFKKSRFITAHEYGHYILHKPPHKPLYAHRDSDKRDELEEQEADYFARSLLMPLEQFKYYYDLVETLKLGKEEFNIALLSNLFKVTRNKIIKRLEDLQILS